MTTVRRNGSDAIGAVARCQMRVRLAPWRYAMQTTPNGNSSSQPIIASAMLIALLGLASRFLGLLRDRAFAATYGAGPTMDAYVAAFRIPDFLFNLLGLGALTAAFLPVYVRLRSGDTARAHAFASALVSDFALALTVLCGIGAIVADPLYRILAPGFPEPQLAITVSLGRVMFLGAFLLGASTVFGGILQAERRFTAFAFAPLAYNAGIIAGVLFLAPRWGLVGLAWGVVLGAFLHAALQISAAWRSGFRPTWRPLLRDHDVQRTIALLAPRMVGLASSHVQIIVVTAIASTLAAGSLAVFTFANNIQMVPVSLIGIAFAVAAFPHLSAAVHDPDRTQFRVRFSATFRQIALFAFPAIVMLLTLKAQVVRVLLGTGVFDWDDTVRTLATLEAFGFGLFAAMVIPLLTRSFYAFEDTRTPFLIGILADVVGIAAAFALGRAFGPRGLAFAISIAAVTQMILLLVCLRVRAGALEEQRIASAMVKFAVAAFLMAIAVQVVKPVVAGWTGTDTGFGIGLQGALGALAGGVVYLSVGVLLRSEEITALARTLHRGVLRTVRLPFGGADEAQG